MKNERINEMNIYNVAGVKVYAQQFNEKQISILTTHLSKGMYLVKVHTDKGVGVKKLVIE